MKGLLGKTQRSASFKKSVIQPSGESTKVARWTMVFHLLFLLAGNWVCGISYAHSESLQKDNYPQENSPSNNVKSTKRLQEDEPAGIQIKKSSSINLRHKVIGAENKEFRFAWYINDWVRRVTLIGALNFPEEARRNKISGSLMLGVSIKADGSLEKIEIIQSSGLSILDAAAMRIVKLASPFAPFSPEIAKDTDVLTIIRKWTFTPPQGAPIENKQSSESVE